jgi:hypothetical protein
MKLREGESFVEGTAPLKTFILVYSRPVEVEGFVYFPLYSDR